MFWREEPPGARITRVTIRTPEGVQNGLLFPYNQTLTIYRCPADKSTVELRDGTKTNQPRWRSYNLSQSINGWPEFDPYLSRLIPSYRKFSQIRNPGPSNLITFLEVHEDSIYDALFGIPTQSYPSSQRSWWDIPASRHPQSCNLAFADGHAENWKWRVPKVVRLRFAPQYVPDEELPDYERIQRGFRQTWE